MESGESSQSAASSSPWLAGTELLRQGDTLGALTTFVKCHQRSRLQRDKVGSFWALWHLLLPFAQLCASEKQLGLVALHLVLHEEWFLPWADQEKFARDASGWARYYAGFSAWMNNFNCDSIRSWLLTSLEDASEPLLIQQAHTLLADVYMREGNFQKAVQYYEDVQSSPLVDDEDKLDAMLKLCTALAAQDEFGRAEKVLDDMRSLAHRGDEEQKLYGEATVLKLEASINFVRNQYLECNTLNSQAAAKLDQLLGMCFPHMRAQVVELSLQAWDEIVASLEKLGKNADVAKKRRGEVVKASLADQITQVTSGNDIMVRVLSWEARRLLRAGKLDTAEAAAAKLLKLSVNQSRWASHIDALIILADICEEHRLRNRHTRDVAESLLLSAQSQTTTGYRQYRVILCELAGLYCRTEQWSKAVDVLETYAQEFMLLEAKFGDSSSARIEYTDSSAKEAFHCLQVALVELETPEVKKALVWAERERSRDLLYRLSSRREELQLSTFDSDYDKAWEELKSISNLAGKDTVFLIYTVQRLDNFVEDEFRLLSYLLHSEDEEPRWHKQEEALCLESFVYIITRLMSERSGVDTETIQDCLYELYKMLVEPWSEALEEIAPCRLVIIPAEVVSLVPFAGLVTRRGHDGEADEFLIQRYMISYAPSLRVFRECHERKTQLSPEIRKVLVVGNPDGTLASAAEEADTVIKILQDAGATQLVHLGYRSNNQPGDSATRERLLEEMQGADWIHVASHAVLEEEETPRGAIVLRNDPTLSLEEQRRTRVVLRTEEIEQAKVLLSAKAVILSACSTGLGSVRSEGTLGLTRALLQGGAPKVIASMWDVENEATKELMSRFYVQLVNTGMDAAMALHSAMKSMTEERDEMEEDVPKYRTYQWAAFFLSGTCC